MFGRGAKEPVAGSHAQSVDLCSYYRAVHRHLHTYVSTHRNSWAHTGTCLHTCVPTHPVCGEYRTPTTTHTCYWVSFRDSIHVLTGIHLDTHQLTTHRTAFTYTHALKNPGTLSVSKHPGLSRLAGVLTGGKVVEVVSRALPRCRPVPIHSTVLHSQGKEPIAMAAPDPWLPIGSLVAMGYRAVSRPL